MSHVGARVVHPVFGRGKVVGVVAGGRTWTVAFDARPGLPYRLNAHHVTVLDESPRGKPAVAKAVTVPTSPTTTALAPPSRPQTAPVAVQRPGVVAATDARIPTPAGSEIPVGAPELRQCLEALRMGVVPTHGLDQLTVDRDRELTAIGELVRGGGGMQVLCGGYGTGKSHLVEVAESQARAANWLVARASFDAIELPPSQPVRLYRALASNIAYPDDPRRGLRPLVERLSQSPRHTKVGGARFHRWLSPAAWACAHEHDAQLVADTIAYAEGEPMWMDEFRRVMDRRGWKGQLLALPDYRTFGQLMAHLLGGVAAWAEDAGYGGLLVLLDEAEYLDTLGTTSRTMAEYVLKYLAIGALPPRSLSFEPDGVYRGGHEVHRKIPSRYAKEQPLAVLCAFTPLEGIDRVLRGICREPEFVVPLEPVRRTSLGELGDRVYLLARQLHPNLGAPDAHRERLRRALVGAWDQGRVETTRDAARMAVEFWDIYRRDPAAALAALA